MSVGLTPTKAQIDSNAGSLWIDLETCLGRIEKFSTWLQATPDLTLTSAPYSYSAGEVATLKSAYVTDMLQLLALYRGTQTLGSTKDFRTFAKQLGGFGQY